MTILPPDSTAFTDTAASAVHGYTYRITVVEPLTALTSPPFSPPDHDHDGLPDGVELGASYNGATGTFATQSATTDTDSDGMADGWEIAYALDPLAVADAAQDPDADGFNNRDEHDAGSDPRDRLSRPVDTDGDGLIDLHELRTPGKNPREYYDGFTPIVEVVSGGGQQGLLGELLSEPLIIAVKHPDGRRMANAPITVNYVDGRPVVTATHADQYDAGQDQLRTSLFGYIIHWATVR